MHIYIYIYAYSIFIYTHTSSLQTATMFAHDRSRTSFAMIKNLRRASSFWVSKTTNPKIINPQTPKFKTL